MNHTKQKIQELREIIKTEVPFQHRLRVQPSPHKVILETFRVRNENGTIQAFTYQGWQDITEDMKDAEMIVQTIWQRVKTMQVKGEL